MGRCAQVSKRINSEGRKEVTMKGRGVAYSEKKTKARKHSKHSAIEGWWP